MTQTKTANHHDESTTKENGSQAGGRGKVREYAEAILLALVLALFIRTFVVQAFKIPSPSMVPTLLVGDHILVNKFLYGLKIPLTDKKILSIRQPKNGDIVVFKMKDGRDFIKRVIGTPGDEIALAEGRLTINGEPVELEPVDEHKDRFGYYFTEDLADEQNGRVAGAEDFVEGFLGKEHLMRLSSRFPSARSFKPVKIPAGKYFVMGDNRDNSYDSRFWGFVDTSVIKGKAMIIYWSWDKVSHLPRMRRLGDTVR